MLEVMGWEMVALFELKILYDLLDGMNQKQINLYTLLVGHFFSIHV
jgi:hypothetical protein